MKKQCLLVCIAILLFVCSSVSMSAVPSVTITNVSAYGTSGYASGQVSGVSPVTGYSVAVYIYVQGWWNKPLDTARLSAVDSSGHWTCDIDTGGSDIFATGVSAFLVPNGTVVPLTLGSPLLPTISVSLATCTVNRGPAPRYLNFAGKNWLVKRTEYRYGPGPNYFTDNADNIWTDSEGMHLTIKNDGTYWRCTEAILQQSYGYGQYIIQTHGNVGNMDQNAVIGIFTFDATIPYPWRELDVIEYSRWNEGASAHNAQFVVQPFEDPANRYRFDVTTDANTDLTHYLNWYAGSAEFKVYRGRWIGQTPPESALIMSWTRTGASIPTPGNETFRFNFWLYNGAAPLVNNNMEFVVTGFQVNPLVPPPSASPIPTPDPTPDPTVHPTPNPTVQPTPDVTPSATPKETPVPTESRVNWNDYKIIYKQGCVRFDPSQFQTASGLIITIGGDRDTLSIKKINPFAKTIPKIYSNGTFRSFYTDANVDDLEIRSGAGAITARNALIKKIYVDDGFRAIRISNNVALANYETDKVEIKTSTHASGRGVIAITGASLSGLQTTQDINTLNVVIKTARGQIAYAGIAITGTLSANSLGLLNCRGGDMIIHDVDVTGNIGRILVRIYNSRAFGQSGGNLNVDFLSAGDRINRLHGDLSVVGTFVAGQQTSTYASGQVYLVSSGLRYGGTVAGEIYCKYDFPIITSDWGKEKVIKRIQYPAVVGFSSVPRRGDMVNPVRGYVKNMVNASPYFVIKVYINVGDRWWPKPTWANPVTRISSGNNWSCYFVTGGTDQNATDIAACLVPSYRQRTAKDYEDEPSVAVGEVHR